MVTIAAAELQSFATALLAKGGATSEEADRVGASLVDSNLRGYESHGVMRIPYYVKAMEQGEVRSGASLDVIRESDTHLVCDANWGLGQMQAGRLLKRLSEKAREHGLAAGTMLHSGHIGRLGEYCEAAAADNLVSILMVNSHGAAVRVAPPGGTTPRLSTNPLAIGVPHGSEPLVLDFSTSATAEGKVRVKRIAGEACPPGWLLDHEGQPTNDPDSLYGDPPGSIRPMGGDQAYKGFGLGLMIEILTGALSGGRCAREPLYPVKGNCVFLQLMDPDQFGGGEHFSSEVSRLIAYVRSSPTAAGVDRILLPGDPERGVYEQRSKKGVSLDSQNWAELEVLADELDVPLPDFREE